MPPFSAPKPVITGLKEKAESLYQYGDRLYVGTAAGNLHIYEVSTTRDESGTEEQTITLLETKKSLARKSIDQLGYIKEINSLVVLSEMVVTLFPLPGFAPPTPLAKAKAAFSFATPSSTTGIPVSASIPKDSGTFDTAKAAISIPSVVTQLMVGCRRKVVIYTWKDGEAQEVREAPLPHSPRAISFFSPEIVGFAYAPDYALFSIPSMSTIDVTLPLPVATSTGMGMGAFSGLTGYMSLGLGAKAKPTIAPVGEGEIIIAKDNEGIFIGKDGRPSRDKNVEWVASPDEIAFIRPYVFSVFPGGSLPSHILEGSTEPVANAAATTGVAAGQHAPSMIPTNVVQIRSAISSHISQLFSIPFPVPSPPTPNVTTTDETASTTTASTTTQPTPAQNATIHIPLSASSTKSPLYIITTPTDRAAAAAEGSSIWQFVMRPWADQIDELVLSGYYADALQLLDVIEDSALPDKEQRRIRIRALNAVSQFRASKFQEAIDAFFHLDFNPAKVIALYPETVSGRLAVPQREWIQLYGGPAPPEEPAPSSPTSPSGEHHSGTDEGHGGTTKHEKTASELLDAVVHTGAVAGSSVAGAGTGTIKKLKGTGLGLLAGHGAHKEKDDDAASIRSARRAPIHDDYHLSIEILNGYLVDKRTKLGTALASVNITPQNQYDEFKPLSEVPISDLFALPDAPLSVLTPEELLRFAQVVDTALYKSEVEEDLRGHQRFLELKDLYYGKKMHAKALQKRASGRFLELKDLYYGKKMHAKALQLLQDLSEKATDVEDRLRPSITYLQKLGPEYLDHIFQFSRWIFETDADMAFEIFLSEDVELPHQAVANYLESIDPQICAKYLEYIIEERYEESPGFHDRLAELYINMTLSAKRRNEDKLKKEVYTKLLKFLNMNDKIGVERLYGLLSLTDLYEARAILLGRLGRHDQALELYVYRLHDYLKAEEYCKRIYQPNAPTSSVFLTLLRIYLRPNTKQYNQISASDLLQPALDLISRHNPRLDPVETLNLLPPLVTAQDVRAFLFEALRAPIFDTRVVRCLSKARNDIVARRLMVLQGRKVKVTDSRICPQCHKRLGNSVVAVHAPRGEVTHYQCREAFSRKLNESRV
ncbi:Vam6/Vps39-like protein [Leucoagaricus sp. SymC.cos]|nr:Vam6/Vps39-like protein [Leucoagaricus sp. SymC.cos]